MSALTDFANDVTDTPTEGVEFDARVYVFHDGTSHKFWASLVHEGTFIPWWGRIGYDGSCKIKRHASANLAQAEANRVASSKLDKNYMSTWHGTITIPAFFLLSLEDGAVNLIPPANLSDALIEAAGYDPRT